MKIWSLRKVSKHLRRGVHQTCVYSGLVWIAFIIPLSQICLICFLFERLIIILNLVCSECSTITKEMCISYSFCLSTFIMKKVMHQWLDVGSSVASWFMKGFELIGRDARSCIQFGFDLGKRLDVGSSICFFVHFLKVVDFNLWINKQLIQ